HLAFGVALRAGLGPLSLAFRAGQLSRRVALAARQAAGRVAAVAGRTAGAVAVRAKHIRRRLVVLHHPGRVSLSAAIRAVDLAAADALGTLQLALALAVSASDRPI